MLDRLEVIEAKLLRIEARLNKLDPPAEPEAPAEPTWEEPQAATAEQTQTQTQVASA